MDNDDSQFKRHIFVYSFVQMLQGIQEGRLFFGNMSVRLTMVFLYPKLVLKNRKNMNNDV